ncbi:TatD DNase family protein [Bacillus mesophilus]|uniref:TatD family hydrolase n=1 Tax=Bacillus mesophilus TaxID=1808955 RepID=A0A6M0QA62_9BACI|nr:TatD family hydrolase [Bacillus mesophilus]MBM7662025.1 TatD DNase family protein [Bacillus mesophilus]NEY72619.1 TatD family hydrolase [Bacillus mesophilus]
MIDAHIHLDQYTNAEKQIDSWLLAGVSNVIAVSTDLSSSYRTLELQGKYPDFIHAAVGFHPERPLPRESDFIEWESLVKRERSRIIAIGEIGLPHYNLAELKPTLHHYEEFLSRCLEVSARYGLPAVLHAVHDKAIIVYELLQKHEIQKAHFHWLKAPLKVVNQIVESGYYISVTPEVCYRSRDQDLANNVPLSQLLMETDGPWRFGDIFSNLATTPLLLNKVADQLAVIKGEHRDLIVELTTKNTKVCYNIKSK